MIRMGEGLVEESLMKETNFLAGLFQQIVADCKVLQEIKEIIIGDNLYVITVSVKPIYLY